MLLYQLTRPISYLLIKDGSKRKIDWLLPIMITSLCTILFFSLAIKKQIYGENGLVKDVQGFLQLLPGFYLAALAAIATFDRSDLDDHLPSPTPKIKVIYNGVRIKIKLTRRRMLSYLFGYLTFESLCLYVFTLVGSVIKGNEYYLFGDFQDSVFYLSFVCFNLFFWQMMCVTIFGLYQLCERIHEPNQTTL